MKSQPLSHLLAFSGAIPFIVSALLLAFGITTLPMLGSAATVINAYGLAIVAFMAGCHWGIHLSRDDKWATLLPIISNAVTLIAWFAYLLFSVRISLLIMAACFLALLLVDAKLRTAHLITQDYYQVRAWVSKIVILSLCVASVFTA